MILRLQHCSGKNNVVADILSRLPGKLNALKMDCNVETVFHYASAKITSSTLKGRLKNFKENKKYIVHRFNLPLNG